MTQNPSPVEDGKSAVAGTPGRHMSIGTKAGVFGLVGVIALGYIGFNAMLSHRQVVIPASAATNGGVGQTYNSPPNALIKVPPAAMPTPTTDQAAFPIAPNKPRPRHPYWNSQAHRSRPQFRGQREIRATGSLFPPRFWPAPIIRRWLTG